MSVIEAVPDPTLCSDLPWSADDRLIYEIVEPETNAPTWGVAIWDLSLDRAATLYGFTSPERAEQWIQAHSQDADLADFPHLRMARSMYRWSQATGTQLPDGEVERVSEELWSR